MKDVACVSVTNSIDLFDAYSMYVDMKIGDKNVAAMVDSGATHTFVVSKIIKEYGMKVMNCLIKMKVFNSAAQSGYGMITNVPLKIEHWSGVHTLIVVPLDDFNILLGIDFMRKFKVTPISHLDGVYG